MITDKISTTVTHIDTKYRFTFHPSFGGTTGLIEIEIWENRRWSKGRWKRIYFGFITPIEGALQFFNRHLVKPIEGKE